MADSGSLTLLPPTPSTPPAQPVSASTDQSSNRTKRSPSDSSFGDELEKAKKRKAEPEKKAVAAKPVAAPPVIADKTGPKPAAPASAPAESAATDSEQLPVPTGKPVSTKPKTVIATDKSAEDGDSTEADKATPTDGHDPVQPVDQNDDVIEKPIKAAKTVKVIKSQTAAVAQQSAAAAAPREATSKPTTDSQPVATDDGAPKPVAAKSKPITVKATDFEDEATSATANAALAAASAATVQTPVATTPTVPAEAKQTQTSAVTGVTAFGTSEVADRAGAAQGTVARSASDQTTPAANDAVDSAADVSAVEDTDSADEAPAKLLPHVGLSGSTDPTATTTLPPVPMNASATASHAASSTAITPQARFTEENSPSIVAGIQGQLLPHGGTMQLQLHPAELGALQVTVHLQDGVMTASFQTSNEHATRLLSHSLGELKSTLEAAGMSVEKLHVEQAPKQDAKSNSNSDGDSRQSTTQDQQGQAKQDQQRREMVQRMWRKLSGGGDPLDMVA